MSRLRRSSIALALAASTTFAGAAVTPAVAQDSSTESSSSSSSDLPESVSGSIDDIDGSLAEGSSAAEGSIDDSCGDTSFGGIVTCAVAGTIGATAALAVFGVLRTLLYEVGGI
ncbi:MAG: hypothetical protein ACTH1D_11840 [Mycobacteriaceae bacterium]|uniref:hypothetical protein n=1 Tax=Corynebacterium sp. TaxID=1720 RepID=UPI003F95CD70